MSVMRPQSPKNPLVLIGRTCSGQVDYPSLSNCRTRAKKVGGQVRIPKFFGTWTGDLLKNS